MKLRKLVAFGAAALVAFGAQAQAIKVGELNS